MLDNYIVKYVAFDANNKMIKHGTMRCKNRMSKFDAMAGLEKHLEKKLEGFARLIVLSAEVEQPDNFLDLLTNLMYKK